MDRRTEAIRWPWLAGTAVSGRVIARERPRMMGRGGMNRIAGDLGRGGKHRKAADRRG